MTVELAGLSDRGRARDHQEDALDLPPRPLDYDRGVLIIVADGVGGLSAGDEASRLAVDITRQSYESAWSGDTRYDLASAVAQANAAVFRRGQDDDRSTMGTTIVACVLREDRLYVAHVGDSRLYRLRGGELQQLTVDHSLVQSLIDSGDLSPEEARTHPKRHVVTRSLGYSPTVEAGLLTEPLWDGDRFLLCTDGLYDLVDNAVLAETLLRPPQQAAQDLIDLANDAGGSDNITVAIAAVTLPPGAERGMPAGAQPDDESDEQTKEHPVVEEQDTAEHAIWRP